MTLGSSTWHKILIYLWHAVTETGVLYLFILVGKLGLPQKNCEAFQILLSVYFYLLCYSSNSGQHETVFEGS